jgi:hypothetical protein
MYARNSFFVHVCVCQKIIQKTEREKRRKRARENINNQMTSPIVANLRQPILPSLLSREERHPVVIGNLYMQIHWNNMCVYVCKTDAEKKTNDDVV